MSSWTYNGNVKSLQVYLYRPPPPKSPTNPRPHRQAFNAPPQQSSSPTQPVIKIEEVDRKIPIHVYNQEENDYEVGDYDDCYEDVFQGSLPWNQSQRLIKSEYVTKAQEEYGYDSIDAMSVVSESLDTPPSEINNSIETSGSLFGSDGIGIREQSLFRGRVLEFSSPSTPISESENTPSSSHVYQEVRSSPPDGGSYDIVRALKSFRSLGIAYDDPEDNEDTFTTSSTEPPTPCPQRKHADKYRNRTGRVSKYFPPKQIPATGISSCVASSDGTARRLNFSTPRELSIRELRAIEFPPTHKWSKNDRVLLCVLQRWFTFTDGWDAITVAFNTLTEQNLLQTRIKGQWGSILDYKAHPEWRWVFEETPFEDSEGVFEQHRNTITAYAEKNKVGIHLKQSEDILSDRKPWQSRPPNFQREYRRLLRQVLGETTPEEILVSSLAIDVIQSERDQLDDYDSPIGDSNENTRAILPHQTGIPPVTPPSQLSRNMRAYQDVPSIGYRVHDRTKHSPLVPEVGFRSAFFFGRKSGITSALPPEHDLLDAFAEKHFWEHAEGVSPFVSVTTSLLFAILMAKRSAEDGNSPLIATINLTALKGSVYNASSIIRRVKRNGELPDMRYKGTTELLVWGEIPETAISHRLLYTELEQISTANAAISEVLRLERLNPKGRVYFLHEDLVKDHVPLSPASTIAVATLVEAFGLDSAPPDQLQDFIHNVVDGFAIDATQVIGDDKLMRKLATSFLNALDNNHTHRTSVSDTDDETIINTFIISVQKATDRLEQNRSSGSHSRSRSGRRR